MNQRLRKQRLRKEDAIIHVDALAARLGWVFVHIPKTGGTSIKDACGVYPSFGHKTALRLREEIRVEVWKRSFKFCFVRNPWDRMVSWFEFGKHNIYDKRNKQYDSFEDWILDGARHNWGNDWRLDTQDDSPLRQFNFLMDWKQDPLVDFIGRFENLQEDFQYIADKIGRDITLPRSNVTMARDGRHYREYYNAETREVVRNMLVKEIEYFGYEF